MKQRSRIARATKFAIGGVVNVLVMFSVAAVLDQLVALLLYGLLFSSPYAPFVVGPAIAVGSDYVYVGEVEKLKSVYTIRYVIPKSITNGNATISITTRCELGAPWRSRVIEEVKQHIWPPDTDTAEGDVLTVSGVKQPLGVPYKPIMPGAIYNMLAFFPIGIAVVVSWHLATTHLRPRVMPPQ